MLALAICVAAPARADVVTDWNARAGQLVMDAKVPAPIANRILAIVQTAVFDSVNAISASDRSGRQSATATPDASIDAAVAAANHAALARLLPREHIAAVDAAYQAALAKIDDTPARAAGIALGEQAAAAIIIARDDDGAAAVESYRPRTEPGVYLPTVVPAAVQWPQRRPWLLDGAAQFRPGPPPALDSALWARDYNEIKALGARNASTRTAAQTDIARFWEVTQPTIYHALVRGVAEQPGRDVARNARLFAAIAQGMDDALIAVFDAKYHYNFWRPFTAIRNGDIDGNDATQRDASWLPLIETPMHPEYPCAHCILASTVGTILKADIGDGPMPTLSTTSPTAKGAARSWTTIEDFVQEVNNGRIYDGVHYRNSTEVGAAMGRQVGARAVERYLRPGKP
jgi:hypothetical protein